MIQEYDTIAAIASAPGQGAIGVLRLSGAKAMDVLRQVFVGGVAVDVMESHRMYYGKIQRGDDVIDEVMVCPMLAPRSFTRENTVEIYAHGGMFVLSEVLGVLVEKGARLAQPGEFTKRAFLNGRINLAEAEAVMDIIGAKSSAARRAGLRQLGGGLTERLSATRDKILMWLAHIELSIDYPEHEDEAKNAREILSEGDAVIADLEKLQATAAVGKVLREGVRTAIIGRPNAGKSTLLNAILSEDRAIVHELPGTTRDVLTEEVRIGDVPLVVMDTAGIRDTVDPIEKIGVEKTLEAASDAELILYVAERQAGATLVPEDMEILAGLQEKISGRIIVLLNKCDLFSDDFCALTPDSIDISAKTGQGLDDLYARVREIFLAGEMNTNALEADIITRERHKVLIGEAIGHVRQAMSDLASGVPEDLVSFGLRAAYIALGGILGMEIGDDIVDRIFAEFCVGK